MQQSYHERPTKTNRKRKIPAIPGGVYTISPLAAVSVWAALKMQIITWQHLCAWIALHEVRTWRDTRNPAQRNLFRFTTRLIALALGKKRAGPRLKTVLADLERLGLVHLTPTVLSFTKSLDDLPIDLRAETERMLRALGNSSTTRGIRMPRRLMRLIMRSRPRPLRVAVIFGMLLRIMPIKRYGWYKGCLTTALLVDLTGFNESRIKHQRASLIREGYFQRMDTPNRVRQQHGDWYALAHDLPLVTGLGNGGKRQPPRPPKVEDQQPPIMKPVPSYGMETNQFLPPKSGALCSNSFPEPKTTPSWDHMTIEDLREPRRRARLHEDACRKGAIGDSPAEMLVFYAAIARARRLATRNPCGMLRRIVQTKVFRGYIADCDEDQAREWLADILPPDPDAANARHLLRRIVTTPFRQHQMRKLDDGEVCETMLPEHCLQARDEDSTVASYFTLRLRQAGFPIHDAFCLIMTTHEGREKLAGWDQQRWDRATTTREIRQVVRSGTATNPAVLNPFHPTAATAESPDP